MDPSALRFARRVLFAHLMGLVAVIAIVWFASRAVYVNTRRLALEQAERRQRLLAGQTAWLAELVCSNSLKSEQVDSAPWLLKEELRKLDSLLLAAAEKARVPGGHALTVDRDVFAAEVTGAIANEPLIEVRREEVKTLTDGIAIIATGPLTSEALATESLPLAARTSLRLLRIDRKAPSRSTAQSTEAASSTAVMAPRDLWSSMSFCSWPAFRAAMREAWLAKSKRADISAALVEAARSRASSSRRLKARRWVSARCSSPSAR